MLIFQGVSEIVWFFHWQRKRGSKNSSFTWSSIQNVYGIKTHIHISSFFRPGSLFRWLHLYKITKFGSEIFDSTTSHQVAQDIVLRQMAQWTPQAKAIMRRTPWGNRLWLGSTPVAAMKVLRIPGCLKMFHVILVVTGIQGGVRGGSSKVQRMSIDTPSLLFTVTTLLLTVTTSQ